MNMKINKQFILLISLSAIYLNLIIDHLSAQTIKNEQMIYKINKVLSKNSEGDLITEVINVPLENPEPFLAFGLKSNLLREVGNNELYIRHSKDKISWSSWQKIDEEDSL